MLCSLQVNTPAKVLDACELLTEVAMLKPQFVRVSKHCSVETLWPITDSLRIAESNVNAKQGEMFDFRQLTLHMCLLTIQLAD